MTTVYRKISSEGRFLIIMHFIDLNYTPEMKKHSSNKLLVNKSIYSDVKIDNLKNKYTSNKPYFRSPQAPAGLTTTDMLKIIALRNECMHKVGMTKLEELDNDLSILEKTLQEETTHLSSIKNTLAKTCDIDGSNTVYHNSLVMHSLQPLTAPTQTKIKSYLSQHISNFKPPNQKTKSLIEKIKSENSEIIKKNGNVPILSSGVKSIQTHELIDLQRQERENSRIKEKLNLKILPNMSKTSKVFINLDVEYDFIPKNEEFLRRMRLDFVMKKDKIVKFIYKIKEQKSHQEILYRNKFETEYLDW